MLSDDKSVRRPIRRHASPFTHAELHLQGPGRQARPSSSGSLSPSAAVELARRVLLDTVETTGNDRLMVGFNRRIRPDVHERHQVADFSVAGTTGSVARYAVNAGQLGLEELVAATRFSKAHRALLAKGGHFMNTLGWWFDSQVPIEVFADGFERSEARRPSGERCRFSDGSVAIVSYVTNGNARYPKEIFEVSAAGRTARLDNFRRATVWTGRRTEQGHADVRILDKGQAAADRCTSFKPLRRNAAMPIGLDSLAATTRATFAVAASQASGRPEPV